MRSLAGGFQIKYGCQCQTKPLQCLVNKCHIPKPVLGVVPTFLIRRRRTFWQKTWMLSSSRQVKSVPDETKAGLLPWVETRTTIINYLVATEKTKTCVPHELTRARRHESLMSGSLCVTRRIAAFSALTLWRVGSRSRIAVHKGKNFSGWGVWNSQRRFPRS